ncbi:MAG: efflux RND transporter periplasmic adaptor subunit [Polyangiaceae bacterium]|nr:efflux RND transporter periplasmic adaptor subunit [Polyangiaceae bacterium]
MASMPLPRPALLAGLGLLALAGAPSACRRATPTSEPPIAASAEAPRPVRFVKVTAAALPRALEVDGTLEARERSLVAAQAGGAVRETKVELGSRVKRGDPLVVLDTRGAALRAASAAAAARQARARVGAAKTIEDSADVKGAREGYELARREAERAERLASEGAISASALDQARTARERAAAALDIARSGAEQARAMVVGANAQLALAHKELTDGRVRAPFDGAVVERRVSVGEFVGMGQVVAILVDDTVLRLRFDVPEADSGRISLGAKVTLGVAAQPGRTFEAKVTRIAPSVTATSRRLPVEAELPNTDAALKPGYFARATVELGGKPEESLLVPQAAIGKSGTASRVFVRDGGRVVERLVVVGRKQGDLVAVEGDLRAGDEVATSEVERLGDGVAVAAQE